MNDLTIAEYLDRRLAGADRERAELHLAGCAECRDELAEVYEFQRRAQRPRRLVVVGLAAAAAVLLFAVRPALGPRGGLADDTVVRSGGAQAAIVAYGPMGETSPSAVRFVWGAQPGAASYRLTVTGQDGTTIWSRSSADTAVALPDSISLRPGERYRWIVDALLNDGATRSTGLREFRAMP